MRIAFTHNLKTDDSIEQAEFDTPETIEKISASLRSMGHDVHPVDVSGSIIEVIGRLEVIRPQLVFNTAEGTTGRYREAFYPALFEQMEIPYVGSSPYTCGVTLDKQATKLFVERFGVQTPKWLFVDSSTGVVDEDHGLRYPIFIKPNFEGSSKGISQEGIVQNFAELRERVEQLLPQYPLGLLLEEFIVGDDVTVPYVESLGVLSPIQYVFEDNQMDKGYSIYDYHYKNHASDQVSLVVPAPVSADVRQELKRMTEACMRALDVRDMGRADFRVTDSGEVYFIELNALPSLESGASIYEAAIHQGVQSETAVLEHILSSAVQRYHIVQNEPVSENLRIGLTYNLKRIDPKGGDDEDAEFDSIETVTAIANALRKTGHEVFPLEANAALPRIISEYALDLVFNIAEGIRGRGRESQVPALLDILGIEYTGSDTSTLAVTLDKAIAKQMMRHEGIRTSDWYLVQPGAVLPKNLGFPLIAKPNAEGSSKGIHPTSFAKNEDELRAVCDQLHGKYGSPVLVEEFLPGREFTVGLLEQDVLRVLPIMEIVYDSKQPSEQIYSFAHKTETDAGVRFDVPAQLDEILKEKIETTAKAAYRALGCRDVARIDIRLDRDGEPSVIECNPLPGLTAGFSDLCVIAQADGMSYDELLAAIVAPAIQRFKNGKQV